MIASRLLLAACCLSLLGCTRDDAVTSLVTAGGAAVARLVPELLHAFEEAERAPEAAIDAMLKANAKAGQRDTLIVGIKLTTPLYHTDATKGQRPLRASMKDVNESLDLLVQYGGLDPALRGKAEDWVTNDFLP